MSLDFVQGNTKRAVARLLIDVESARKWSSEDFRYSFTAEQVLGDSVSGFVSLALCILDSVSGD